MKIECIPVGLYQANCYVLTRDHRTIIIDPGSEFTKIKQSIRHQIIGILITHYHFDHIGALDNFDKDLIIPNKEGQYKIGPFKFEIILTKGHTKDSYTYYFPDEKCMFTGDFLFKNSIGRTDFEGGNLEEMKNSIIKIKTYPNDIKVYPGHGPATTLDAEKKYNPFF
jgi:glyoxylase-like metal-dependent hydrolase (beta-lactamase superfamily II)